MNKTTSSTHSDHSFIGGFSRLGTESGQEPGTIEGTAAHKGKSGHAHICQELSMLLRKQITQGEVYQTMGP